MRYISNFFNLKYLIVKTCFYLNDTGIQLICTLPKLEISDISECMRITGSGFKIIPNLRELNCSVYDYLKDRSLLKLLGKATNLKRLDISDCAKITISTINAVIKVLKNRSNYCTVEIKFDEKNNIN